MKNVLVTAARSPLGHSVIHALRQREGVEQILGLESSASSEWNPEAELMPFPTEHREFVSLLAQHPIDTVVHCGLAPDRTGSHATPRDARVVETMQLGAAIADPDASVRSWVIASSSDVYPVCAEAPLLHRECSALDSREGTIAASIQEAEDYARDIADRRPHLDVAILRLQQLVGEDVQSPMQALLAQRVLPRPLGYDPHLQLLEFEDAVDAIAFAAELELAGVYNVASAGTTRMSEITEGLEKPSLPVLPVEAAGALGRMCRRFGAPHVPEGLGPTLRFGHALDCSKLASAGFSPRHDQLSCVEPFRARRPEADRRELEREN